MDRREELVMMLVGAAVNIKADADLADKSIDEQAQQVVGDAEQVLYHIDKSVGASGVTFSSEHGDALRQVVESAGRLVETLGTIGSAELVANRSAVAAELKAALEKLSTFNRV